MSTFTVVGIGAHTEKSMPALGGNEEGNRVRVEQTGEVDDAAVERSAGDHRPDGTGRDDDAGPTPTSAVLQPDRKPYGNGDYATAVERDR